MKSQLVALGNSLNAYGGAILGNLDSVRKVLKSHMSNPAMSPECRKELDDLLKKLDALQGYIMGILGAIQQQMGLIKATSNETLANDGRPGSPGLFGPSKTAQNFLGQLEQLRKLLDDADSRLQELMRKMQGIVYECLRRRFAHIGVS
jgi:hypothetical protein